MAANAVVSKNQHGDGTDYENISQENGGGYQQIPLDEQEDEGSSDDDSVGRLANKGCLENSKSTGERELDEKTNTNGNQSQNMSVVQALASGVEVVASEG